MAHYKPQCSACGAEDTLAVRFACDACDEIVCEKCVVRVENGDFCPACYADRDAKDLDPEG